MATDWLLLDGSSLMFRAFFGIPVGAFKAPDGQPVNAVRGFLDMLARLVSDRKPKALVVATDEDWRPAFRVKVIASYKMARLERGAMPAELQPQEPIIWAISSWVRLDRIRISLAAFSFSRPVVQDSNSLASFPAEERASTRS